MPRIDLTADTIFYVDCTRPDDSGDGLTPATAKKTFQAAYDNAAYNYDLRGHRLNIRATTAGTYAGLSTATGCVGQAGYAGLVIEGRYANDSGVLIDGGGGNAIQVGANSSGCQQFTVQNLSIRSLYASGISVFGSGNGVIASNVTFGACAGAAMVVAHGAEGAFQNYILFNGTAYGCLAQAVTNAQFTGGESATWAIGNNMSVTLATLFCANATMNMGGLVSVNPRLVTGNQIGADAHAVILTGGGVSNVPGTLGTVNSNNGSYVS